MYGNPRGTARAAVAVAELESNPVPRAPTPLKVVTLFLEGEVGPPALASLEEQLASAWRQGLCHVILDFAEVSHLDYRGVRPLLQRAEDFRRAGGDLKLSGLSAYLSAILRASGAHGAFEAYATPHQARDAFLGAAERA